MRTYTQDKGNRILGRYPHALRRNWALFFFQFFSNLVNLSLEVKDWRIFHWWKWKIGRPKTQGSVLFKEGRSEVLPKGLHRRAQTLPRQQWIRCTFLDWLYTIFNRCFLFFSSLFNSLTYFLNIRVSEFGCYEHFDDKVAPKNTYT